MIGFVLAAGFGTRMHPLSDHLPKALVPVCGRPVLGWMLERLWQSGIETIGVNAHHLADHVYAYRESSSIPFSLFHESDRIRGTGGAIHFARDFLSGDETFCICNAEPIKSVDMAELAMRFLELNTNCALVCVPCVTAGTIFYNRITNEYTGTRDDALDFGREGNAFYIGIAFYRREVLDLVTSADFSAVPIWRRIQEQGGSTKILLAPGVYWRDIGTPVDLAGAYFDYLNGHVEYPLPEGLSFEPEKKRVFPKSCLDSDLSGIGPNCWIETSTVPAELSMESCIVLNDSRLPQTGIKKNSIVTPWGDISFER